MKKLMDMFFNIWLFISMTGYIGMSFSYVIDLLSAEIALTTAISINFITGLVWCISILCISSYRFIRGSFKWE